MKRILALALAGIMIMSLTSVAFAATAYNGLMIGQMINGGSLWADDVAYYAADSDGIHNDLLAANATVEPDSKIYYPISYVSTADMTAISSANVKEPTKEQLKGYKAYGLWKVGMFHDEPTIEYVKYPTDGVNIGYGYAVVVTVPMATAPAEADIQGSIALAKNKNDAKAAIVTATAKPWLTVDYKHSTTRGIHKNFEGEFAADASGVQYAGEWVEFAKELTDTEIVFGDEAVFAVNLNGLPTEKMNLRYNTNYNKEFAEIYPDANIDFFAFESTPQFNHTGALYIMADKDKFVYKMDVVNGATDLEAVYDEAQGAYRIDTKRLESYVISDKALQPKQVITMVVGEGEANGTPADKPNPDTGR